MDFKDKLFLEALKASLKDEKVTWDFDIQPQDWLVLFQMANIHHVLPMIYEAVYDCPAAKHADRQIFQSFKKRTVQMVMLQTIKTSEFLQLFQYLKEAGIKPCVVKGIVCRNLYPKPDYRLSGDEDVLIPPEQFRLCHDAFMKYGMSLLEPGQDIDAAYEVPYGKAGSPIYIELHKSLFSPDSEAFGEFNRFFDDASDRLIDIPVQGVPVSTMEYTDHLFYLICHAFKHFVHSGFGIRQVCDIVLFANAYGTWIDWQRVLQNCRSIHADLFTAALFRIGKKYLTFNPKQACYPAEWRSIQVDETPMLEDLLASGIYGDSNMSRKHSSNITLNAVSAQRKGKKPGNNVLKTVFPSAKDLERRFPYLKKHPCLLPVAWGSRILKYHKESSSMAGNNAADSIKIGNQRIELMRKYGIIK